MLIAVLKNKSILCYFFIIFGKLSLPITASAGCFLASVTAQSCRFPAELSTVKLKPLAQPEKRATDLATDVKIV